MAGAFSSGVGSARFARHHLADFDLHRDGTGSAKVSFLEKNALLGNHPNSKSASGQMVVFIMAMKLNEGISMKLAWTLVIKQKSAWHMPHRMPEAFER